MSVVSVVALLALHHLRGRGTGLLLLAIVITLLPLFGPRAATVALYQDGEIAKVTASISSGEGDVGVTRVLTARAPLPWDKPLRQTCLAALFLLLSLTLLRRFSGREATQNWPHWVVITLMVVHALALVGSTTARTIAKDKEAVVKVAHNTLSLELAHGEEVKRIDVNEGEFTGGRGSPANTLPLTLLALGLVLAAVFPLPKESTLHPLERKIVSGAIVALSLTIATGIAWSNISWGGAIIADPKLYAALAALACLALYLVAVQPERKPGAMAGWFILAAFLVLLISMIGPELGWTAPSLHHFGA
jgi:ABC-type transport system involved in cytochrome c biogenesis permease subunit